MLHLKKIGLILFPRGDSNHDDIEKLYELSQENQYYKTLTITNWCLQLQGLLVAV